MNQNGRRFLKVSLFIFLLLLLALLLSALFSSKAEAETLSGLILSIRDKGIYFDEGRYPDSMLKRLFNEHLLNIACIGRTNEAETLIVMAVDASIFSVPSDYYLLNAVVLNADPDQANSKRRALKYVPSKDFGKAFTYSIERPDQVSIWNDSIIINVPSVTGNDSLTVYYFRYPKPLTDDTSTVDLPDNYLRELKEAVRTQCLERIIPKVPQMAEVEQRIRILEDKILGRPEDER